MSNLLSPNCMFRVSEAEKEILADESISEDVRNLRFSAIRGLPGYLNNYVFLNLHEKVIDIVCKEKLEFLKKAKTTSEIRAIMQPPKPKWVGGRIECDPRYYIAAEELLLWAMFSPYNKIHTEAAERYIALFHEVFGCSISNYKGEDPIETNTKEK